MHYATTPLSASRQRYFMKVVICTKRRIAECQSRSAAQLVPTLLSHLANVCSNCKAALPKAELHCRIMGKRSL